jgi:hypothetical protein
VTKRTEVPPIMFRNLVAEGEEGNMDTRRFTLISARVRYSEAVVTHSASVDFEFIKLKFDKVLTGSVYCATPKLVRSFT